MSTRPEDRARESDSGSPLPEQAQQQPDREPPHWAALQEWASIAEGRLREICELHVMIERLRTENEQLRFAAQTNLETIQAMQRLGVV